MCSSHRACLRLPQFAQSVRLSRGPSIFMVGIKRKSFPVGELASAGVRRISLATSLYRAAMTGLLNAAREVKDLGQYGFPDRCVTADLNKLMRI